MKILILSALADEMQSLKAALSTPERKKIHIANLVFEQQAFQHHDLYFAYAGIGTASAGIVLGTLHQALQPDFVIFIGTAGGIAKQTKIGDIIIASEAIDIDISSLHDAVKGTIFESTLINPDTNQSIPKYYVAGEIFHQIKNLPSSPAYTQHIGMVASSNHFPTPVFMFDRIKSLNALAIDMESSAIYQAGWLLGINAIVIRCISNMIDDEGNDPDLANAKISLCADHLAMHTINLLNTLTDDRA